MQRSWLPSVSAFCVVIFVGVAASALAADKGVLGQTHPWARFPAGSWRKVQIVTENFDDQGKQVETSSTDNVTTIEETRPDRVSLRVEVTVEVGGRRFPAQPQVLRQGFLGEAIGQTVSLVPMRTETIRVGNRDLSCYTEHLEILGGQSKEVGLISYCASPVPRIVRRQTTSTDVTSGATLNESTSQLKTWDEVYPVLGQHKHAFRVTLKQKSDRGTTTTESIHVPEIPGEIVHETSEKTNATGQLERRSKLELMAYSVEPDDSHRDTGARRKRRAKRGR